MNDLYLMVVELIRNYMFQVIVVTGIVLGIISNLKVFDKIFNKVLIGSISTALGVAGLGFISFKKAKLEPYTCFYKVDNFRGYNPREFVAKLQIESKKLHISIDLARKVQAKNLQDLILESEAIEKRIKEETYNFADYDSFPQKTEFMVLAHLDDDYTLLSENKNVVTGFKLQTKEYLAQDDYKLNQKCSVEITRLAQEQGYLVKN